MEGTPPIIDQQYESGYSLVEFLKSKQELTLLNEAEKNFSKNILLSVASFFEKEITDIIFEFAKTRSNNDDLIVSIIMIKAVKRQFHTYFSWDEAKNANSFFAVFGEDFKAKMTKKVKEDAKLEDSIKAFLQLGQERNKLVHQNYAEAILEKTAEEIYKLYQQAMYFVDIMKIELIKK